MTSHAPDPIHQFEVSRLINISIGNMDLSFTNVSFFIVLTVILSSLFLFISSSSRRLVPTRMQSVSEMLYEFVASTLRESSGTQGMQFFPLVFSLFVFVLIANFIGLFPYFYTITSQIVITFSLAMLVILTVIGYGFYKHGLNFLKLFVPSGVPVIVLPLVTMIEIISFLSRPISLSFRLFANMLAGHITLKVFSGFIVSMVGVGIIGLGGAILSLAMTVAITALEFLVAFLQAYVFTVLTCMYINDAVHPGH
ncbi:MULTISPECIES: F0F1 ATP synthase subunit A [Bartonella]|uniref:ATP synthase subunit a n=1 Tax=Bartonella rochalimae ATCC BAA-1498 TaxID=685782 RepID=E6YMU3_9HYPH|nr:MULTISPECIES: F0F1 ATP synthase subunit A [Bartonella]AQX18063.1 ATP synthase F0 subcomplex A subunit [Bartonella sp. A1379B]AQX22578.1 F-type H+-transporting ATPase subunit a [Bartonella sp. 11B]AQX24141.1 F-type H+-transporting ATPase subunit a [Bartonella sp. 114]AQX25027.1 ATP synthase F0 subcomplex A subunit [Bartonella sp. Coyote22sub2]KEC56251.1 ATP synthase subunit A [Bartonella rochalimae ATCC BAA-1498]